MILTERDYDILTVVHVHVCIQVNMPILMTMFIGSVNKTIHVIYTFYQLNRIAYMAQL
mgnify:CR=1 FL=1